MKTVFHYLGFGALLGALPGLIVTASTGSLGNWTGNLVYTLLACLGAILGTLAGSTQTILHHYQNRHLLDDEAEIPGFWADIFSIWSPPVGHAQRDWRHRLEYRRQQIYHGSIVALVVVLGSVAVYALMRE